MSLVDAGSTRPSDERLKTFADTPHRDWTTDIADAARYTAIVARHIAPKAPPKAELSPGIPLPGVTMGQWTSRTAGRQGGTGFRPWRNEGRSVGPILTLSQEDPPQQ